MNKFPVLLTIIMMLSACSSGCATLKPSTIIGASIGATVGTLAGTMIGGSHHPMRGALIGMSIGTAVGAGSGILYNELSTKRDQTPKLDRLDNGDGIPAISRPEVSCVELQSRIEGNKFYKKHEVCTIEKGAVWMME